MKERKGRYLYLKVLSSVFALVNIDKPFMILCMGVFGKDGAKGKR